jgi:hypothetical protein
MKSWTSAGKIERGGEVILEMEIYLTERKDSGGMVYWSGSFYVPAGKIVEPGTYRLTLLDNQSCEIVIGSYSPNSPHTPREVQFEGSP